MTNTHVIIFKDVEGNEVDPLVIWYCKTCNKNLGDHVGHVHESAIHAQEFPDHLDHRRIIIMSETNKDHEDQNIEIVDSLRNEKPTTQDLNIIKFIGTREEKTEL